MEPTPMRTETMDEIDAALERIDAGLERIEKKIAHLWDVPEKEMGLSPAMMGAIRRYARAVEEQTGELPDWALPYMEGGA